MPRQNDTSITRAAIMNAAQKAIENGGVGALSVSKIAQSLSMSHGNVYRHFASKEALMAEVAAEWMSEMRDACERAVKEKRTTKTRLLSLVLAIREELYKRADDPEALSIFQFVLTHRPDAAVAHHSHRQTLMASILIDAGWPSTAETQKEAQTILDALRFYTDPHAVSAYRDWDMSDQIERVASLLATFIETRTC